jgi:hypothetical protein
MTPERNLHLVVAGGGDSKKYQVETLKMMKYRYIHRSFVSVESRGSPGQGNKWCVRGHEAFDLARCEAGDVPRPSLLCRGFSHYYYFVDSRDTCERDGAPGEACAISQPSAGIEEQQLGQTCDDGWIRCLEVPSPRWIKEQTADHREHPLQV